MKATLRYAARLIAYSALPLISACGHRPAAVSDHIITVQVPVAVQPIKPTDVPAAPAPLGPRPPTLQQQADTLFAKLCEFESYTLKADPLLRLSAGEPPKALPPYPECESHQ
jgi:hypothetical protein